MKIEIMSKEEFCNEYCPENKLYEQCSDCPCCHGASSYDHPCPTCNNTGAIVPDCEHCKPWREYVQNEIEVLLDVGVKL